MRTTKIKSLLSINNFSNETFQLNNILIIVIRLLHKTSTIVDSISRRYFRTLPSTYRCSSRRTCLLRQSHLLHYHISVTKEVIACRFSFEALKIYGRIQILFKHILFVISKQSRLRFNCLVVILVIPCFSAFHFEIK